MRDLDPESIAEYKHFITKYGDQADEEIIAFAEHRMAYLSKKKPVDGVRWLVGTSVSAVVLVAGFAQINMWMDSKPKDISPPPVTQTVKTEVNPDKTVPEKPVKDFSPDNKAFNDAKSDGRISAYGGYVKSYPDGLHIKAADKGAWTSATTKNTVAAYSAYKQFFPKGAHIKDADSNIDKLTQAALKSTDSPERDKLKAGCEKGNAANCNSLGYDFDTGKSGPVDTQKARIWYTVACTNGNATRCSNLGVSYETGEGGAQDYFIAFTLYKQACDNMNKHGCHHLGHAYESSRGVEKDMAQAKIYYKKACDLGDQKACDNHK